MRDDAQRRGCISFRVHKRLIVNADDLGISRGVNAGILRAHLNGIVTSTSLMVRGPAADEAASLAKQHPSLDVGLHVDLEEWEYGDDGWFRKYAVLNDDARTDPVRLAAEVRLQVARFRELIGHDPSHLDSHQHVHQSEPLKSVMIELANELAVPLRHDDPRVRYCGEFYGQSGHGEPYPEGITVKALCRILQELTPGITELCCHPGIGQDHSSCYSAERERECAALCDQRVRTALGDAGIKLTDYRSIHEMQLQRSD